MITNVLKSIKLNIPYSVLSKKFELISPKICRAGGIPPQTPFLPARRNDPFGLDDFKFFVPLLAELWASSSLAANSINYQLCILLLLLQFLFWLFQKPISVFDEILNSVYFFYHSAFSNLQ